MIPLSSHLTDDFVAWHKTKNHIFSVRSAYYTEWDHQFGAQTRRGDGQGASRLNAVWQNTWGFESSRVKFKYLSGGIYMDYME
jgi:hypothetical protein